jgi:Tfp pilus assembly PilM family ATPase
MESTIKTGMLSPVARVDCDVGSGSATLLCPACNESNSAQRRYCSKCGGRLWDACLACGAVNHVDERFCGACGAELSLLVQERRRQLEKSLAAAEQSEKKGLYLHALDDLKAIEQIEHSRLKSLYDEVAERIRRYPQLREQAIADAGQAMAEAQELLAAKRVDAAYARLHRVPLAFQNSEIKQLLDDANSMHAESQRLRALVDSAVRDKKYNGLLPLVERLAQLNSDDAKVAKMLEKLRAHQAKADRRTTAELLKLAQAALAKCDYQQALAAVRRIPAGELDGDAEALAVQVRERFWLFDRLRTEPYASPTLVRIAERLKKLQPSDGRLDKLLQDLAGRCAKEWQLPGGKPATWARPPESTMLGMPVDLAPIPKALSARQPHNRESATTLLVAYGLALQAAGQAKHSLDLCPDQGASWLGRVGKLAARRTTTCWGIDVGSSALKAVKLSTEGRQIVVQRTLVLPYANSSSAAVDAAVLRSSALRTFLNERELAGCSVAINLPGAHTLGRFFEMPAPRRGKFDDAVRYEVRARLPLGEDEAVYDFESHEIDAKTADSSTPRRRVMLVAGRREQLQRLLQPWQEAHAARIVVQSECLALSNAAAASSEHERGGLAYLEIGSQTTNLVAITPAGIWFRGLYAGMASFDQTLATKLNVTRVEAEALRRQPDRSARMHEIDELMQGDFAALAATVQRGLKQLHHETAFTPRQLLLCGGGAYQFGLLRYLRLGR